MTASVEWCSMTVRDHTELHAFPVPSERTLCRKRRRDGSCRVLRNPPSAPGLAVCMACWEAYLGGGGL